MKLQSLEPVFGYHLDTHPILEPYRHGKCSISWCPFYGSILIFQEGQEPKYIGEECNVQEDFPHSNYNKKGIDAAHPHICLGCPAEREARHSLMHRTSQVTQRDTLKLVFHLDRLWESIDQRCEMEDCASRKSTRGDPDTVYLWYRGKWYCYLCKCGLDLDPEWTDLPFLPCELPHPNGFPKATSVLRWEGMDPIRACDNHSRPFKITRLATEGTHSHDT